MISLFLIGAIVMSNDLHENFSKQKVYFFIIIVGFSGYSLFTNIMKQRAIELNKSPIQTLANKQFP